MQTLLCHLNNPHVQEVLTEWFELRSSGLPRGPGRPGPALPPATVDPSDADDLCNATNHLLDVLRALAEEQVALLALSEDRAEDGAVERGNEVGVFPD